MFKIESPGAKPRSTGLECAGAEPENLNVRSNEHTRDADPQMAPCTEQEAPAQMSSGARPLASGSGLCGPLEVTSALHLFSDPPPGSGRVCADYTGRLLSSPGS